MSIKNYYKEVLGEMKNVVWPTGRHTSVATAVVIFVSALVAAYLFAVDRGLEKLLTILLNK